MNYYNQVTAPPASENDSGEILQEPVTEQILVNLQLFDRATYSHSINVAALSTLIGSEMTLSYTSIETLRLSGLLHDAGKLSVPVSIIKKPGALESREYEIVKGHVVAGADLLKQLEVDEQVINVVAQHHERIDGSGYPEGLKSVDIFLESKILAVADCLDAMAANRPYRSSLGLQRSLDILKEESGYKLDATVVDAVLDLSNKGHFNHFIEQGEYLK